MKKLNKKALKIVAATSMAVFSLLATMTSAYAWFESIRNQDTGNEDFYIKRLDTPVTSITIHNFYGETTDGSGFAFDPVGVSVYEDGSFNNGAPLVELHQYSVEKPNHPVLILFKNDETLGYESQINLVTDFAYLGEDDDFITAKTQTKDALNNLSKTSGKYYQVVRDESQSNQTYLYQYDGSALQSMTFATYAALDVAANRTAANNGKYFRVQADEQHGNVATCYQYNNATALFEMVWCDLGNDDLSQTNPLSSAVEFHAFTFSEELENIVTTADVNVESFNSQAQSYSYTEDTLNCITINKNSFDDDNKSSFASFNNAGDYLTFNNEICVFRGDITGVTYIGMVVNYNQLALEYVFSRNLGHNALNAERMVFKCDWRTEF